MSGIMDLYRQDEQRALDRLVDGELSNADARELLAALDRETDGWRRCALAFVESQALRGVLRGAQADVNRSALSPIRPASFWRQRFSKQRPWQQRRWFTGLALAASLLVTFSLGLFLARDNGLSRWFPGPSGKSPQLVDNNPSPAGNGAGHVGRPLRNADVWRTVKLNFDDPLQGKRRDIELPVRDMASVDPHWGDGDESAISAEVLRAWEQSGHVVKRERELWPIDLQDGRRLVVPVEQVEVQNIGYQ